MRQISANDEMNILEQINLSEVVYEKLSVTSATYAVYCQDVCSTVGHKCNFKSN